MMSPRLKDERSPPPPSLPQNDDSDADDVVTAINHNPDNYGGHAVTDGVDDQKEKFYRVLNNEWLLMNGT